MNDQRWEQLVLEIKGDDIDLMVKACESLYKESETSDVPRLLELLRQDDFVVREAAAWPLASVGGPDVLPELFAAYERGFEEGHDNDGFTTVLIELVSLNPQESLLKLRDLQETSDPIVRKHSGWLLQFC